MNRQEQFSKWILYRQSYIKSAKNVANNILVQKRERTVVSSLIAQERAKRIVEIYENRIIISTPLKPNINTLLFLHKKGRVNHIKDTTVILYPLGPQQLN